MGACVAREDQAVVTNRSIEDVIRKAQARINNSIKILLLGPGESGKSTIFKQMKILQVGGGFTQAELQSFISIIHSNCITQMKLLLQAAAVHKIAFQNQDNVKMALQLLQLPPHTVNTWNQQIAFIIHCLWQDKGIQDLYYSNHPSFTLNDTADYFFSHVERIGLPDFIPTVDDVLRVRARSTGVEEAQFMFEDLVFSIADVGGQRSERRKWIHCFDGVTAILFCVALSDYNVTLREDHSIDRMREALDLFEGTINSTHFRNTTVILFLNKVDLFQSKILMNNLAICFPNYQGGGDFKKACSYVEARFRELVAYETPLYVHFTCALDTNNIAHVINDVKSKLILDMSKEWVL